MRSNRNGLVVYVYFGLLLATSMLLLNLPGSSELRSAELTLYNYRLHITLAAIQTRVTWVVVTNGAYYTVANSITKYRRPRQVGK